MSYTKEQRAAKAAKLAEQEKLEKQVKNNDVTKNNEAEPNKSKSTTRKKKLRLDDHVSILVASNVFGLLTYVNHKSGDKYQWQKIGDVQSLYVSDLRAMKSNQVRFFEENWVLIEGIADSDEEFDEVTDDDIYDALQITQYYKDRLCPKNIGEIFNWSNSDIKLKVPKMAQTVKESLVVRANELIKSGVLDSISKVKALEEVLNCELASPDEDD